MKIELEDNQAALILTLEEDGESCNMRIVYDRGHDDFLPINIQMLYAVAELFQGSEQFMESIHKTIVEIFKERTTH